VLRWSKTGLSQVQCIHTITFRPTGGSVWAVGGRFEQGGARSQIRVTKTRPPSFSDIVRLCRCYGFSSAQCPAMVLVR
jgi:hypothetical protein